MSGRFDLLTPFRGLYWALKRRIYLSCMAEKNVIERFHMLYYDAAHFDSTWVKSHWLGTPLLKSPHDLWIYQEILHETTPDVIIETGTYRGGSARYLASLCDLMGRGRVVTIDIDAQPERPQHERITYIRGSSADPEVLERVRGMLASGSRVMVVLDSDHTSAHVTEELRLYAPLVTAGCYLIVEDTNINGHPAFPEFGPGPFEAVEAFLRRTKDFERDYSRERFMITFNPGGYLRRVR